MSELLGFYSGSYQYAFQVSILGVGPVWMGDNEAQKQDLAPIVAIPKALKLAGITKEDLGLIELNEAFASQSPACVRELELNRNWLMSTAGPLHWAIH